MYELVHLLAERVILFCQTFRQMFLVDDFLGRLVAMECQSTTRTLHDDGGAQTAENTGLVVLGRVQSCNNHIVWVVEWCATSWTCSVCIRRPGEAGRVRAAGAENMATSLSLAWVFCGYNGE